MTFQTFKRFVLMSVFFMTTSVVSYAQQSTMQGLIGQSLAKLQQPTSESILNCIAEMKRIDDMFQLSFCHTYFSQNIIFRFSLYPVYNCSCIDKLNCQT